MRERAPKVGRGRGKAEGTVRLGEGERIEGGGDGGREFEGERDTVGYKDELEGREKKKKTDYERIRKT